MKVLLLSVIFILVSCMPIDPYLPEGARDFADAAEEIFIINSLAETISVIQPVSGDIYHDVNVTGIAPKHIMFHADDLYVVNSLDNRVDIYIEDTLKIDGSIYLGKNKNPWMLIMQDGTEFAWVPNFTDASVAKLDLGERKLLKTVPVGGGPEGGVYHGGRIFVCNTAWNYSTFSFDQGSVSIIDTASDNVVKTVMVATNPQYAVSFPALDEVHVVCTGINGGPAADDGMISILDGTTGDLKTNIFTGGSPGAWALHESTGTVYLGGVGGVLAYNLSNRTVTHPASAPFIGTDDPEKDLFSGLCIDQARDRLYLADFSHDRILVYSLPDGGLVREYAASDGVLAFVYVTE